MADRSAKTQESGVGDAALERLFWAHHRAVLAYCARRVGRSDAWDAASEVFIVAWKRLDEVPAGDDARPWLLAVAHRVLANQRRGSARRLRLFERAAKEDRGRVQWPEEQLIRNEDAREVIEGLARLRPPDREILQLVTWEELSPVEIAGVLGISREAVDQRYSRAKRRLARELERRPLLHRRATEPTSEKGGAT